MEHLRCINRLRWAARLLSIVSLVFIAAFIVGEGVSVTKLTAGEWLGFLCFPIGISIGMVVAWWKETLGGIITVGSLVAFYLTHIANAGKFPAGWAWFAFAAPGFLFLALSYCSAKKSHGSTI